MAKNLLIVESPAKAKTINKYLGKDFLVLASYGHVRDLPGKDGAVNVDDNFAMRYEVQEKNQKYVDAITKAAKDAEAVYLASDPDREGEAIAWHIGEILEREKPEVWNLAAPQPILKRLESALDAEIQERLKEALGLDLTKANLKEIEERFAPLIAS